MVSEYSASSFSLVQLCLTRLLLPGHDDHEWVRKERSRRAYPSWSTTPGHFLWKKRVDNGGCTRGFVKGFELMVLLIVYQILLDPRHVNHARLLTFFSHSQCGSSWSLGCLHRSFSIHLMAHFEWQKIVENVGWLDKMDEQPGRDWCACEQELGVRVGWRTGALAAASSDPTTAAALCQSEEVFLYEIV